MVATFAPMRQGALCISIDVELAWGIWDRPSAAYLRLCAERERAVVRDVLGLLASREIPATWAVVGQLLRRPRRVPVPSEFGDRIWYAPDVVEAIHAARPVQDIGSHGFAHIYFHQASRDEARADLQAARAAHDEHGLAFTSFVFPRNQVDHLDLLAQAGIAVFRSADRGWHAAVRRRLGTWPGRAANLMDKVLPVAPAVVQPSAVAGPLVELPGSLLLLGRAGARRVVPPASLSWKARLGLRRAARSGRVFHLWFHPSNFYWDPDVQLRVLQEILDDACELRERGLLEIRTMASYAQA